MAAIEDLVTLGECRHLAGLEFLASLMGIDDCCRLRSNFARGSCAHSRGRSGKAIVVECSWLVGVHLVSDFCGTQFVGVDCHAS